MGNLTGCCSSSEVSAIHSGHIKDDWLAQLKQELKGLKTTTRFSWPDRVLESIVDSDLLADDHSFVDITRWYDYITASPNSQTLQFIPYSHAVTSNFFDIISEDMETASNPASIVVANFTSAIMDDFYDTVQGLQKTEEAKVTEIMQDLINQLKLCKSVVVQLLCSYYQVIKKKLCEHPADVDAVVYSQLVKGEVYRMLYQLALRKTAKQRANFKSLMDLHIPITEVGLEADDERLQIALDSARSCLGRFAASESPFEKLYFFEASWKSLHVCELESTRTKVIAWIALDLKLSSLHADNLIVLEFCNPFRARLLLDVEECLRQFRSLEAKFKH